MAAPTRKQLSTFPDLPRNPRVINEKGEFTDEWRFFFEQLITSTQQVFSSEGTQFPQQSAANIALLNTANSIGRILYNNTANSFMGNVESSPGVYTWKTFTLT